MAALVANNRPGRALDLGCGEGRNAAYLAAHGWDVVAVDIDAVAIKRTFERTLRMALCHRIVTQRRDVLDLVRRDPLSGFTLVLLYGLLHCIADDDVQELFARLPLGAGTVIAGSALTDEISIPHDHGTGPLFLRSHTEYRSLLRRRRVRIDHWERGWIEERHAPIATEHRHAALWFIGNAQG